MASSEFDDMFDENHDVEVVQMRPANHGSKPSSTDDILREMMAFQLDQARRADESRERQERMAQESRETQERLNFSIQQSSAIHQQEMKTLQEQFDDRLDQLAKAQQSTTPAVPVSTGVQVFHAVAEVAQAWITMMNKQELDE